MLPVFAIFQLGIVAGILIPWTVAGWPLLWFGIRSLKPVVPSVGLARCFGVMAVATVSALLMSPVPFLGLPAAFAVFYLLMKWMLRLSHRNACRALLPTLGTIVIILPFHHWIFWPWWLGLF
jgi:hypothetical protein